MNSIITNKYLVKRVNFRVSILPIAVKILSVLFLHIIFLFILIAIFLLYGYRPTIYWLQLPFYVFMMVYFGSRYKLAYICIESFYKRYYTNN